MLTSLGHSNKNRTELFYNSQVYMVKKCFQHISDVEADQVKTIQK